MSSNISHKTPVLTNNILVPITSSTNNNNLRLNSTGIRSRYPNGPKELVDIEKMRLEQILENEVINV